MKKIILNIIKKIEELDEDLFVWAYKKDNRWEISVSDYNFYSSKKFQRLCSAWRKIASNNGFKLIFVCGWTPTAEKVYELSQKTKVIINI